MWSHARLLPRIATDVVASSEVSRTVGVEISMESCRVVPTDQAEAEEPKMPASSTIDNDRSCRGSLHSNLRLPSLLCCRPACLKAPSRDGRCAKSPSCLAEKSTSRLSYRLTLTAPVFGPPRQRLPHRDQNQRPPPIPPRGTRRKPRS